MGSVSTGGRGVGAGRVSPGGGFVGGRSMGGVSTGGRDVGSAMLGVAESAGSVPDLVGVPLSPCFAPSDDPKHPAAMRASNRTHR